MANQQLVDKAPIVIEATAYWKVRAYIGDHDSLLARHQREAAESKAKVDAAAKAAGLVEGRGYTLDDRTMSAIPTGEQL